jgi:hypothetical protein
MLIDLFEKGIVVSVYLSAPPVYAPAPKKRAYSVELTNVLKAAALRLRHVTKALTLTSGGKK